MRALIIHNQRSGFGSNAIYEFQRALLEAGDEALMRCPANDFTPDQVLGDAEDFDLVVLSGGDGTMASLLYELRGRDVPTCVFPSGTSNLLFINLGNAPEPASIAAACRDGRTIRSDLGEMSWVGDDGEKHTKGFCLMSGTGYDADIMHTAAANKQAMGEVAYFAAAVTNLKPTVSTFTIEVDGVTYVREGISCIVANNAMIQNDIEIVPDNTMTDGLLDVIVLEAQQATDLLRPITTALFDKTGKHGRPRIESFSGKVIDVRSSEPIALQIDGDPMATRVMGYHAEALRGVNRLIVDSVSHYASEACNPREDFPGAVELPYPMA